MNWKKRNELLTTIEEVVLNNTGLCKEDFFVSKTKVFHINGIDDVVKLIKECIEKNIKIKIVGDYDCDGVTATGIMYMSILSLGGDVSIRLPKRFSEGFGLSEKIVDEVNEGLIITVDNGITAVDAIKKAKAKGLTVIVTDHHLPNTDENDAVILPDADIIIDPNAIPGSADFNDYCGAGLAYKVAEKLIPENKTLLDKLICFAAIGTVADVMPLVHENRRIVEQGLKNMTYSRSRTTGLESILRICDLNKHITSTNIGFKIGPMINAPGRLYDDGANISFEALVYDGKYDESIGKKLNEINEMRKEMISTAIEKIDINISSNCLYGDYPLIIYEPNLNEGIVGIIAGRLAERENSPTIILTDAEEPDILKGSGRSACGVNLKDLLDECSNLLYKYGGHESAAGMSVNRELLTDFIEKMQEKIPDPIDDTSKSDTIYYDLEIPAEKISEVFTELKKYEPFGEGNPKPVFKINNYKLSPRYSSYFKTMGKDNSVIKLYGVKSSAIGFGMAEKYSDLKEPKEVHLVGTISQNYFRDIPELQVEISDMKNTNKKIEKSAISLKLAELAKNRY